MDGLKNEIEAAVGSIQKVTDLLYQRNTTEGYVLLDTTLALLANTINDVYQYQAAGKDLGMSEAKVEQFLNSAMKAIEEKDIVLLADILFYDIKELLEKAYSNL